jgi:hypothetical protein
VSLFSWAARPFVKAAIKEYAPFVVFTFIAAMMLGYLVRGCTGELIKSTLGGTMDNFTTVWGTVSVFVVYAVQVIGRKLPGDVPILNAGLSLILNGVAVYAVAFFIGVPWDIGIFWPYIAGMQVVSQLTHAAGKTAEKSGVNTLGVFAPKVRNGMTEVKQ